MKSFVVENEHLTRQKEIIPMEVLNTPITVIGAGAVGSWVVLSLAKMGFHDITVFDDDTITIENMNCQFYPHDAIGQSKVAALHRMVKQFANVEIHALAHRFTGREQLTSIVISAVDSMTARKLVWDSAKANKAVTMFIDPRMGAEMALMYSMNPKDAKDITSYEKTLYSDKEAVMERCTAKATIYTANLLAGLVVKAVKDAVLNAPRTRVAQWDIGKNQVQMYSSEAKPTPAKPKTKKKN